MSDFNKIEKFVNEFKQKFEDVSIGVSMVSILSKVVEESDSSTMAGLEIEINNLVKAIKQSCPRLPIHFDSVVQVFKASLSKASGGQGTDWKSQFVHHANKLSRESEDILKGIPANFYEFIPHGATILTRGYDSLVLNMLTLAIADGRQFHVYITEGRPLDDGAKMARNLLSKENIKTTIIPDSMVGLIMPNVDVLLLGTDSVTQDGGILAPVGTYTMCVMASIHSKPVYVVCETYKFMRKFILSSSDLSDIQRNVDYKACGLNEDDEHIDCKGQEFDYTPPQFITLLLTEKGPIPPSAVTHDLTLLFGVS